MKKKLVMNEMEVSPVEFIGTTQWLTCVFTLYQKHDAIRESPSSVGSCLLHDFHARPQCLCSSWDENELWK